MKEIITNSTTIYDGKILRLTVKDVIANGLPAKREIVEKSGAVAVVPSRTTGRLSWSGSTV